MKPIIIYHANCTDGFGAAFAAWKLFGNNADYLPVKYGQINEPHDMDLLGGVEGRSVFILDFSFPRPVMLALMEQAGHVTWLDHHKTAFEMWCPDMEFKDDSFFASDGEKHSIVLDNKQSGALIAWDYFVGGDAPALHLYIDDYDRWQFKMEGTRAFGRALRSMQPWDFEQWVGLSYMSEEEIASFLKMGEALLRDHQNRVDSAAKHVRQCFITTPDGVTHMGLATNAPADIASDTGNELAKACGTYGLVYQIGADMRPKISLRSIGDYDVTKLAAVFGGGGHKNASGCSTDMSTLLEVLGHAC